MSKKHELFIAVVITTRVLNINVTDGGTEL